MGRNLLSAICSTELSLNGTCWNQANKAQYGRPPARKAGTLKLSVIKRTTMKKMVFFFFADSALEN
jgi:hypothetical protein